MDTMAPLQHAPQQGDGTDIKDQCSTQVDVSCHPTLGFGAGYELRRHNSWAEADAGCLEARLDWARYVGVVPTEFGSYNVSTILPTSTRHPHHFGSDKHDVEKCTVQAIQRQLRSRRTPALQAREAESLRIHD